MNKIKKTITKNDYHNPEPPKLFAWLASIVTVALIIATQFLSRGGNLYLRGIGVFILLLGGVFIFTPFYLITKYGRAKDEKTNLQPSKVVDQGLYAITRHPQYLGYIFLTWGFALLSQHWVTFLLAIVGMTFFYAQAMFEEKYCLAQFGEPYALYLQRIPRFNIVLGILRKLRGKK